MFSPEAQLEEFIARYTPEIAGLTRAVLAEMRRRLPGAVELVYDNYNALAIGFGPTERASDVVFSIAAYPRWVSLFLFRAAKLPDPERLLSGTGSMVRHIVINGPEDLDQPGIRALMAAALDLAGAKLDERQPRRLIVKSVSAKQRPRRPVEKSRHAR